MIYATVTALGDSILYGARCEGRGICERLPSLLDGGTSGATEWAVLNRAVCAEATWQILQRAAAAVRELAGLPGNKVLLLCAGTNDLKSEPDLDWLGAWFDQILHWPRRYEIPVVVCTLPPIDPSEMHCFPLAAEVWREGLNDLIRELPVDAVAELAYLPVSRLLDGVHLSESGHELAAEIIAEAILGRGLPCRRRSP